jgi:GT2 family glycosyltransferase
VISVIIPTHQRPQRLVRCLEELSLQTLPMESFEVVVVNDGGPPLPQYVQQFRGVLRLRMLEQPRRGPAAARNAGAAAARGEWLLFTDDDCLPERNLLAHYARVTSRAPGKLIGGGLANALPEDLFATASQLIVSSVYEYYARNPTSEFLFSTSNLLVPAAQFRQLGGFSSDFPLAAGEDYDFCSRWYAAGLEASYEPAAIVRHAHPLTFGGFCRQHYNYGRGLCRFRRRLAARSRRPLRPQGANFYVWLLSYPLRRTRGMAAAGHTLLVALSQAATAAGVAAELFASRRPTEPADINVSEGIELHAVPKGD